MRVSEPVEYRTWGQWPKVTVGTVVRYEDSPWYVGLVNKSRARLDPLTGVTVTLSPQSGRTFQSYKSSVNISSESRLPVVEIETLDEGALRRLIRLDERTTEAETSPQPKGRLTRPDSEEEEDDDMAVASAPVAGKTKGIDKTKVGKLADAKASVKKAAGAKRTGPATNKCKCGCGGVSRGFFVPGHDARFKGLLLKIERGELELSKGLKKAVADEYTWVKSGLKGADGTVGMRPTKNYKGEAHAGYAKK